MLKQAFNEGCVAALSQFDVKDAGLREKLMPFLLAGGIGGGGTAGAAAVKHMMPHAPAPITMGAAPALPNPGSALQLERNRLDAILNAR